ncbi:MAG: winged helix-turn-helix domain-containing protein [Bdellovibrionota bacterium]|nr:winged helix-turn-helix domain-containing protein [Bdellovibrionota bacterium]
MDTSNLDNQESNLKPHEYYMAQAESIRNDVMMGADADEDKVIGEGFYRLAKIYYDKADLNSAEEFFLKALEKTIFPRDAFAMFKCYGFLIRIYSEKQEEASAQEFIEKAEQLVEKFQESMGSLSSHYFYNVGMVATYKGEFDKALENFSLSYQKAQTENEPELIAKGLYAMANASFNLEKHNEALQYLNQLKELLTILKKGYLKGSMHQLYGNIFRELSEYKLANENYDLAMNLLQEKNCWNLFGYILLGKGIVAKRSGEYNQALMLFGIASHSINSQYQRLNTLIKNQVEDVNDSSVDLYLDRHNRMIHEKSIGSIDFKHRFVLLEILFLLARNPGSSYNKEDLAKSIWKDEYNPLIHDKLIYTSISRLRKLIEPKGNNRKYILRGKDGYTFNPRVNARFHKEDDAVQKRFIGNVDINAPV